MNDFESGYYQCKQDIMKALGISTLKPVMDDGLQGGRVNA